MQKMGSLMKKENWITNEQKKENYKKMGSLIKREIQENGIINVKRKLGKREH